MPVHYKGGGETIKDLLSGEMKIMFSTIPPVLGFVKDGRLQGIATTGSKRDKVLPDLPTIAESGVPGFDMPLWFGLAAPKGTPRPVIDKLHVALKKTLACRRSRRRWPSKASRRWNWDRKSSASSTPPKRTNGPRWSAPSASAGRSVRARSI